MTSWERERQIREEERIRHEERQRIERRERKAQEASDRDDALVEELGRGGAARSTFLKWVLGGVVVFVMSFIGMLPSEGFSEALNASSAGFVFICFIGLLRARRFR